MKRWQLILSIVLVITLFVVVLFATSVSASAATYPEIPSDPYSEVTAPAGFYYFYSTLDGFDLIGNFTVEFFGDGCYFLNYRVKSLEKKNDDLKMRYYDHSGNLVDIVIYNLNTGWNYSGLIHNRTPCFYIPQDCTVPSGFSRILKYRSYDQSLLVSGVYSLKEFAGVDSSIWSYKMSGEFYVDGLLYNVMTIDPDNGIINITESSTLRTKFIYPDDPKRSDYLFEIPLAYVTQSVYNNFYNIFDHISSYGSLIQDSQYYHFGGNYTYLNTFLSNVSIDRAYCPTDWVRKDGSVFHFSYLTANSTGIYGCNELSGGSYTELVKIYDVSTSSLGDYSDYFKALVVGSILDIDNQALVFYADVSLSYGGINVADYYDLIAYNRGLADSNAGYDKGYDDGYDQGWHLGFDAGESIGDSHGYERGFGEGYADGYDEGYDVGYEDGASSFSGDFAGWLDAAIGGFFSLEIFPGFSLGGILSVIVGVSFLMFFLKMFLGG